MCDTFVSLPDATADGSVILAKNSDREPNEAHELALIPAAEQPTDVLRATHIEIPQVPRTHAVLLAKPYWIWGAEMGVNEHGVAIGNEAVFTKAKREKRPGLLGMDSLRLALERTGTAQEAVDVITTLLAAYGQGGQAGHTHKLVYDNSYIVSDRTEAWILETVGRDWAAQRVERSASISNGLTLDRVQRASAGLQGVRVTDRSDFLYTRFSNSGARQCRTSDALTASRGSIDVAAAMGAERISVVDTEVVLVDRPPRTPVVYLVQPLVADLGHHLLHSESDAELTEAIQTVLDRVWALHQRTDSPEVAIDAQLSNWSFTDPGDPVLLDVGTPFMRRNGKHLFNVAIVLSAMPPGIRSYYRRGVAAAYMDDYFVPRLVAVDLLGNFIKERATRRLSEGIVAANSWLDPHNLEPIRRSEVDEYYKKDAAALELFLRVRRVDRAVRHLFGRDYDFILPGRVARR